MVMRGRGVSTGSRDLAAAPARSGPLLVAVPPRPYTSAGVRATDVACVAVSRELRRTRPGQALIRGRGRARCVPGRAVACGGERSLMGTPIGRLTRTIVVKAVPGKYS